MKRSILINQSQGIASQMCNVHNPAPHKGLHVPIHGIPLKPISARIVIRQSSTNPSLYVIYHKLKVRAVKIVHLTYRLVQLIHWIPKLLDTVPHSSNHFRTHSLAFWEIHHHGRGWLSWWTSHIEGCASKTLRACLDEICMDWERAKAKFWVGCWAARCSNELSALLVRCRCSGYWVYVGTNGK